LHAPHGGADIYQVAKNCRTSVEMIEKFYAAHIKTSLNAAAINVWRPQAAPKNVVGRSGKSLSGGLSKITEDIIS
jgi:hypothetical protein